MKGDIGRARRTGNPRREIRKLENVWQLKDFKSFVCGSVAGKGLTGANFGCVAGKGLREENNSKPCGLFSWAPRWTRRSGLRDPSTLLSVNQRSVIRDQREEKSVRSERLSRDRKVWGGANRRVAGEG